MTTPQGMKAHHLIFTPTPRNGSRYDLVLTEDPYGGILVVWSTVATYRWYKGDYLKFLHGSENIVDQEAIFRHLEENGPVRTFFSLEGAVEETSRDFETFDFEIGGGSNDD